MLIVDIGCEGSQKILNEASSLKLFKHPFRWMLLGQNPDIRLEDYYFGIDSKVFLVHQENLGSYKVNAIYKHSINTAQFFYNYISTYKNSEGFSRMNELSAPRNRTNLMKMPMKVSHVVTNPDTYNHLTDYRNKHIDTISKLNFFLIHHLVEIINVTDEIIFHETWGYKNKTNGLYSGLIGDLQTGVSELGATPSFITFDRVDIVDYIAAPAVTYAKFIFRRPPLSYVKNVFVLPFDANVWFCGFLLIGIIFIVVYIIVIWEWKDPVFKEHMSGKHGTLRANIFDVFMMEIGAVSQQGTDVEPNSSAGRIATIFTFVALMFLYTSYSANIVALLQSTTDSIRSLEDMYNSRIKFGVEDIVYAHHYFETAKEPIRKAIYEEKVAPKGQKPNFMTVQEGIQRVRTEFFAFHVEASTGYKLVGDLFLESEKCGLQEISFFTMNPPYVTAKKNSSYSEIFKVGLRKIHETGIRSREWRRVYTRKPQCTNKGSNFGSVGLIDCYYAFLIFVTGTVISLLLLIIEILLIKYKIRDIITVDVFKPTENESIGKEIRFQ